MKYQIVNTAIIASAAVLLNACGQAKFDNYIPLPANRTQTTVIASANLVDKTLVVKWSPVARASKYHLYYGSASGVSPTVKEGTLETRGESATLTSIKDYTDYYFVVTSFNAKGLESEQSPEFKYSAPLAGPSPYDNTGFVELQPGEVIDVAYSPKISFVSRGVDSRQVREWHIIDFHEGNPERSSAHFMIYGCDIRMIKQTYSPLREQHVGANFCFDPAKDYVWIFEVYPDAFTARIYEGKDLRVEIGEKWRVPFASIDQVRIGAGMFGGSHTAPGPISIKILP